MATKGLPKLPKLLDRKIYKTGQTRGADDDEIYQNRVGRSSTVLIPYRCLDSCVTPQDGSGKYENGFIVLISPAEYFGRQGFPAEMAAKGLKIGQNALVFYETRTAWMANNPERLRWKPATSRITPFRGQYIARIPATTADKDGGKIVRGFDRTDNKGAGIRVYEYASSATIEKCRIQLEMLFWKCHDAGIVAAENGMTLEAAAIRHRAIEAECVRLDLMDISRLTAGRILNSHGRTVCPLCLEELSGRGFFSRMQQAEGREVTDLTITQVNLFHITELRYGPLNHRPYNLGWGHHHCNVVVKDAGILDTLDWMRQVLSRNAAAGQSSPENKAS